MPQFDNMPIQFSTNVVCGDEMTERKKLLNYIRVMRLKAHGKTVPEQAVQANILRVLLHDDGIVNCGQVWLRWATGGEGIFDSLS